MQERPSLLSIIARARDVSGCKGSRVAAPWKTSPRVWEAS